MDCNKCSRELIEEESLTCSVCDESFHYECADFTEENVRKLGSKAGVWRCKTCKQSIQKFLVTLEKKMSNGFEENKKLLTDLKTKVDTCLENYATLNATVGGIQRSVDGLLAKNLDERITKLESEIEIVLKSVTSSSPPPSPSTNLESTLAEMEERRRRSFNLIIYKIPESRAPSATRAIEEDLAKLKESLAKLAPDFGALVQRIHRLGKIGSNPDDCRPLKVVFDSPSTANKVLVANRASHPPVLSASSDKTKLEQEYLMNLRAELKRRTDGGEADLTIKYISGVPRIVPTSKTLRSNGHSQRLSKNMKSSPVSSPFHAVH